MYFDPVLKSHLLPSAEDNADLCLAANMSAGNSFWFQGALPTNSNNRHVIKVTSTNLLNMKSNVALSALLWNEFLWKGSVNGIAPNGSISSVTEANEVTSNATSSNNNLSTNTEATQDEEDEQDEQEDLEEAKRQDSDADDDSGDDSAQNSNLNDHVAKALASIVPVRCTIYVEFVLVINGSNSL